MVCSTRRRTNLETEVVYTATGGRAALRKSTRERFFGVVWIVTTVDENDDDSAKYFLPVIAVDDGWRRYQIRSQRQTMSQPALPVPQTGTMEAPTQALGESPLFRHSSRAGPPTGYANCRHGILAGLNQINLWALHSMRSRFDNLCKVGLEYQSTKVVGAVHSHCERDHGKQRIS